MQLSSLKLSCDNHFQRAFSACVCIFKVFTLVGSSQRNYIENAITCSKRTLKTTVATQLRLRSLKLLLKTFSLKMLISTYPTFIDISRIKPKQPPHYKSGAGIKLNVYELSEMIFSELLFATFEQYFFWQQQRLA